MGLSYFIAEGIKALIQEHPFLVSFLGPLIGGEPFFVALAFVSSQGLLPLWLLYLSGSLADMLDDIFWFFVPRWKKLRRIRVLKFIFNRVSKANKKFKKVEERNLFTFIMTSKFLIGSRNLAVMSVSLNKIKFKRFIFVSVISALIWGAIIVTIGWSAGKGFSLLTELFNNVRIASTIIIAGFLIWIFVRHYFHRKAHKKLTKNLLRKRKRNAIF